MSESSDANDAAGTDEGSEFRLKFYGAGDYGTYFQVDRAVETLDAFDPAKPLTDLNAVLELFNAVQFVEGGIFPKKLNADQQETLRGRLADVRRAIAYFFKSLTDATAGSLITDLDFQYHDDLIELITRYKVHERCRAAPLLEALRAAHVTCGEILANKALLREYDSEIRELIASDPHHAEILVAKHFQPAGQHVVYLATSWTEADSRALLDAYLDSEGANPNFVRMIATARAIKGTGLDNKLKLKAQRKYHAFHRGVLQDQHWHRKRGRTQRLQETDGRGRCLTRRHGRQVLIQLRLAG